LIRAIVGLTAALPHSALARGGAMFPLFGMKVSFTQKEYARLLELAHLGLWVTGARPDDPATMPERYGDLAQKVFGLAETFGCADLVESDVNGELFPNEKLTEGPVREKLEDSYWREFEASGVDHLVVLRGAKG
jgi:hypothetical protein